MHTRLKYWRRRRVLTQSELSEKSKVSNQTIVNIERYGTSPKIGTIRKLAKALKIDPSEIFTDDLSQADGRDEGDHPRNKISAA